MSKYIAVMIEPRGVLLRGERATALNKAVFDTQEEAQSRADSQAAFEAAMGNTRVRFAVAEIPDKS